jgi:Tim10/DDP family zinc finger
MSTPEERKEITIQVESINSLQEKMIQSCYTKCISKPKEEDFSIGEMACVDRCVPKYLETHEIIGKEIATIRGAPLPPTYP